MDALFSMEITSEVGDGRNTLFLSGYLISVSKTSLHSSFTWCQRELKTKKKVADAMENFIWTRDICGEAIVPIVG